MGRAAFTHIQDAEGDIQLYLRRNDLGEEAYDDCKRLDIGDIVGCAGRVFTTRTGEISIHAETVTLLSKSLLPLPEKFHGLKDPDLRYRQRYVDLIVNPEVRNTFVARSRILTELRRYMEDLGYLEVETPVLHNHTTNAGARPFHTHHNALDIDMFLRVELELHLKRLIVGGIDRVFEIGRIFRNEGMDARHNPEFTMLEFYEAYANYFDMMKRVEGLVETVARNVCGTLDIHYQGTHISLAAPWKRMTMVEAVKEYAGVDFNTLPDDASARDAAKAAGILVKPDAPWGECLEAFFDEKVEEHLIQPTFIYDYPIEISPLAKKCSYDERLTQRFEFFIYGREMGNAFSELNDPIDQRERFEKQVREKRGENQDVEIDEDFIRAMEYGMPPTGGVGIGVDRLVMLLTDASSIRDVLLFPTMRPLDIQKDFDKAVKAPNETTQGVATGVEEKIDFSKVEIEPLFHDLVDFDTFKKSDFRAVKVLECEAVPKSRKLLKFTLDDGTGGNRTILSGIHEYYEPEELVGKTCVAITNLPPKLMMGIESCGMLISAVHRKNNEERLHLLMLDPHIPAGAKLY